MPEFEFVVEGPAVSLRASHKTRKARLNYHKWVSTVRAAAAGRWPRGRGPVAGKVEVLIRNFYTEPPPDVDNIIKPILDALKGLVYRDDEQVYRVTSEKHPVSFGLRASEPGGTLAAALVVWPEILQITVRWEEDVS